MFERINTSGRTLTPQEIRNCVYQGTFNSLLFELNKNQKWRQLFGSKSEDPRMRDIEFILRFFFMNSSIIFETNAKQISLKKSLNNIMGEYVNAGDDIISGFRNDFTMVINAIYDTIGVNAFKNYSSGKFTKKFHPAIYDAVTVAYTKAIRKNQSLNRGKIDIKL